MSRKMYIYKDQMVELVKEVKDSFIIRDNKGEEHVVGKDEVKPVETSDDLAIIFTPDFAEGFVIEETMDTLSLSMGNFLYNLSSVYSPEDLIGLQKVVNLYCKILKGYLRIDLSYLTLEEYETGFSEDDYSNEEDED